MTKRFRNVHRWGPMIGCLILTTSLAFSHEGEDHGTPADIQKPKPRPPRKRSSSAKRNAGRICASVYSTISSATNSNTPLPQFLRTKLITSSGH